MKYIVFDYFTIICCFCAAGRSEYYALRRCKQPHRHRRVYHKWSANERTGQRGQRKYLTLISFLSYFNCKTQTHIEGNDPHFSRETGLSAWLQRTAAWTCWRCCGSNTTWTPWSPTRCVFLVCGDSFFLSIQNTFPSIELLLLWNAHLKISKSNRLWCRLCPSLPASLPPPLPPSIPPGWRHTPALSCQ